MPECHVWVCRHGTEEDVVEDRVGSIVSGKSAILSAGDTTRSSLSLVAPARANCWLTPIEVLPTWLAKFPTGMEIITRAAELQSHSALIYPVIG